MGVWAYGAVCGLLWLLELVWWCFCGREIMGGLWLLHHRYLGLWLSFWLSLGWLGLLGRLLKFHSVCWGSCDCFQCLFWKLDLLLCSYQSGLSQCCSFGRDGSDNC